MFVYRGIYLKFSNQVTDFIANDFSLQRSVKLLVYLCYIKKSLLYKKCYCFSVIQSGLIAFQKKLILLQESLVILCVQRKGVSCDKDGGKEEGKWIL